MLIDLGSAATDLIPSVDKQVLLEEVSDHHRLVEQTLVNTGIVHTPQTAIAKKSHLQGSG
ncbi:MAG: hypothetical protein B6D70_11685 [gamma proteobacterium symbiont of Stewartia floridana]|nr:hypothetical protein [Candidatus Thiodiazotropha taylori]RLW57787.1 MAG: hypothetical protein B6D75_15975 [gamma proteobacterium symbiont of Stewartia floridana]RLW59758.1 MAG: hypothetical protein B6D70_11685 [gamma proteobacterium symbiont of Stewartia floridana]